MEQNKPDGGVQNLPWYVLYVDGLAQSLTSLVASTKLINDGPGYYLDGWPSSRQTGKPSGLC